MIATEFAEAAKVKEGTITSSPGPIPRARRPRWRADVPELTATQFLPETVLENFDSNSATFLPCARAPLLRTASTASLSFNPKSGLLSGICFLDK